MKQTPLIPVLLSLGLAGPALAQNVGEAPISEAQPFTLVPQATLQNPWAIAPLPDGSVLVSGKAGTMWHVSGEQMQELSGVPDVQYSGQNGMLDVAVAPDFERTRAVYFTYVSPENALVLARGTLGTDSLEGIETLWEQTPGGRGQPGGIIAFGPDGALYLSVGDRMQPDTAQEPDNPRGKILRLTMEGRAAPGNPQADAGGVRAQTWSEGHRNPYGLAFGPDGTLWEHEMGPRGGDELNRIEPGQNYGWNAVSNGRHYSGMPIPDHDTAPQFAAPSLYWTPVIAPAGLAFYDGAAFPDWQGHMLIGGLAGQGLVLVAGDGSDQLARWDLGMRVRDVAVGPQGAVWIIEDSDEAKLYRLDPA
ncbi:dehydrogenase [Thioclava dalianensis]|uniref:Dehydrogenase n=1 Tax=Thioclava dalianensis TaxID=1185766 RepID=A0A074TGA2_9RHOB|nr:PQQ-dependent sugar dehydrogenase [Thioclava dalianensis]KEP70674.1 dehydrogenase [Thioclava dalianensis]SFN05236.1 Glucose/arabinose dehydrogenase, beta-propeller fold [Thioclava dalianensis]